MMIDRTNLPDFFRDMPEERLKELMEKDKQPNKVGFDDAMDRVLQVKAKKSSKNKGNK